MAENNITPIDYSKMNNTSNKIVFTPNMKLIDNVIQKQITYDTISNLCTTPITKNDVSNQNKSQTKPQSNKNKGSNPSPKSQPVKYPPVPTKKPQISYSMQEARTDKRVSLNCAPLTNNTNTQEYIQRLMYVLGEGKKTLKTGQTVWGFLYATLNKSCGLIFPYTPQITFNYTVNYEKSEITHSNLAINHYKNSPPPSISLSATFTADTRANALHMLSAIWFLRAVTKCDFGERANVDNNAIPGMPPPILYLNGYNSVMNNIPVVVTQFTYTLPQDKHYVSLGVNLDSETQAFNDTYLYSDASNGNLIASYNGNISGDDGIKYLNGVANSLKSLQSNATMMETNRYNDYFFNNWLPTELKFDIQLQIQPNLLKFKKKFNLNWYKMGLVNLEDYRGDTEITIPSKEGTTTIKTDSDSCSDLINSLYELDKNINSSPIQKAIEERLNISNKLNISNISNNFSIAKDNVLAPFNKIKDIESLSPWSKKNNKEKKSSVDADTAMSTVAKTYKFDKSGWSW